MLSTTGTRRHAQEVHLAGGGQHVGALLEDHDP
jgi:hypothetical protein